ncbi:uncharacterized protein LOC144293949 isoform X2 [Canis aureus]
MVMSYQPLGHWLHSHSNWHSGQSEREHWDLPKAVPRQESSGGTHQSSLASEAGFHQTHRRVPAAAAASSPTAAGMTSGPQDPDGPELTGQQRAHIAARACLVAVCEDGGPTLATCSLVPLPHRPG